MRFRKRGFARRGGFRKTRRGGFKRIRRINALRRGGFRL